MKNSKSNKSAKKQKQLQAKGHLNNPPDDSLERLLEMAMNPDKEINKEKSKQK